MAVEEKVLSIEEGTLAYYMEKEQIVIKRYRGIGQIAVVPAEIDGFPVTEIDRKTFLSCKSLRKIILPDTIERIGDWAFAHTEALRKITLPRKELIKGKELFLGCKRLQEIRLSGEDEVMAQDKQDGIFRMLAIAVTALHDYYLLDTTGSRSKEWIAKWDEQLLKVITTDDLDGFEELWTCGEEDYEGKDYDIKSYPVEKRKSKLRLAFFRLLHPVGLATETKEFLQQYIRSHTKGTKEPEGWDIVIEEHRDDLSYFQVFAEAGCVTEDNFDLLIADMQEVNAQIKGYFFQYKETHFAKADAFSSFDLDW